MKFKLAKATGGKLPKDAIARCGSLFVATWLVLMLLGQLFTFEDMPSLLVAYAEWLTIETATLLTVVIVVLELAALPALLHMRLSLLARTSGWLAGALAIDAWLFLTVWVMFRGVVVPAALFGSKVTVSVDWWMMTFLVTIGVLYIVAFWRSVTTKKLNA